MSKKKNTLRDLDEFLKQQAASLVSPSPLSEKVTTEVQEQKIEEPATQRPTDTDLKTQLNALLKHNQSREPLYNLIIETLESLPTLEPQDRMLINTVLYLKSGDDWKEKIKLYWSTK